jgi:prophage regulatory protein
MEDRLMNKAEVLEKIGVSFPTLWWWMREGRFPMPIRLGDGPRSRVAWHLNEVEAWIADRPRQEYKPADS